MYRECHFYIKMPVQPDYVAIKELVMKDFQKRIDFCQSVLKGEVDLGDEIYANAKKYNPLFKRLKTKLKKDLIPVDEVYRIYRVSDDAPTRSWKNGFFYNSVEGYDSIFEVWNVCELHSLDEAIEFIKLEEAFGRIFYINKTKDEVISILGDFWKKYPDGMIRVKF